VAHLKEILAEKPEEVEPDITVGSGFAELLSGELDRSLPEI
jgi:hypothetical protein